MEIIDREVLNLGAPHKWLGPADNSGHLWVLQDGIIMGWSESNFCFERAWWLNSDGTVNPQCGASFEHLTNLVKDRPFDPEWLKDAK